MNTVRKLTKRVTAIMTLAFLMTMSVGILPLFAAVEKLPTDQNNVQNSLPANVVSKAYFQKYPSTVEALEQRIGKPIAVKTLADGSELRYYKAGENTINLGYRCYIIKDGNVVGGNLSRESL